MALADAKLLQCAIELAVGFSLNVSINVVCLEVSASDPSSANDATIAAQLLWDSVLNSSLRE
jgi:hypothetical protein